MHRTVVLLLVGFLILAQPSFAQDAPHIEKLLYQAADSFKKDNYFLGVSQVNQACGMLRANPSVSPSDNYLDIAASCLDSVNKSIRTAQSNNDVPSVTRRVYALQPLLQSLTDWDPGNPRWHYEKAKLFMVQSSTMHDAYPAVLQQALTEFQKSLAISNGGSYHTDCQNQIAKCQHLIQEGKASAAQYERAHPRRYDNSSGGSYQPPQTPPQTYCSKCGGSHAYGPCPNTHGG